MFMQGGHFCQETGPRGLRELLAHARLSPAESDLHCRVPVWARDRAGANGPEGGVGLLLVVIQESIFCPGTPLFGQVGEVLREAFGGFCWLQEAAQFRDLLLEGLWKELCFQRLLVVV